MGLYQYSLELPPGNYILLLLVTRTNGKHPNSAQNKDFYVNFLTNFYSKMFVY